LRATDIMSKQFENNADFVLWNEAMTRKYDSEDYHLRSSFLIRWIERKRKEFIIQLLNPGPEEMVVEVGCGAGVVLEQIPTTKRIGLDLSGFILQKTRQRLGSRHAQLIQANAESLPFAEGQFTKLVCTEVIEHVLSPATVVEELARITSPNGVIVITIPNEALIDKMKTVITRLGLEQWLLHGRSSEEGLAAYNSPTDANEWHLHQFDLSLLKKITAGVLVIREVKAIPFAILPLRYVVSFNTIR
jgi:ubiquinone/menaquinone biosynthesis C-methylase UbiE